jgi:hypothetical protein
MQKWSFREGTTRYGFVRMLDRTAHRPFVYRTLFPVVVNEISDRMPRLAWDWLSTRITEYPRLLTIYWQDKTPGEPSVEVAFKYHIAYGLLFLSLLGAMYSVRATTAAVWPGQPVLRDVAPAAFVVLLPLSFIAGGYFYDFPELLCLFLLYWLALTRRYLWMVCLFPLAILNKESTIVLPVLLAPIFLRDGHRKALGLFAVMMLAGGVVFWLVRMHYSEHPGQGVEFHLWGNAYFYTQPKAWLGFMASHAPLVPFPKGLNVVWVLFVMAMLFFGWSKKGVILKQIFWVAVAVNLPLAVLFGMRDEMRNLSLLFPAMYLLSTDTLMQLYASEFRTQAAEEDGYRHFEPAASAIQARIRCNPRSQ